MLKVQSAVFLIQIGESDFRYGVVLFHINSLRDICKVFGIGRYHVAVPIK